MKISGERQTAAIHKKGVSPVKGDKPVKPALKSSQCVKVIKVSEDKDSNKEQIVSKEEIPLEAKVSEESTKPAICKKDVSPVKLDKRHNEDKCNKNVDEEKSQSKTKDVKVQSDSSDSTNKDEGKTNSGTKVVCKNDEMKENPSVVQEAEKAVGKRYESESSKSENDQEKVSDKFEEDGMVDNMDEEKKEDTDGKIHKLKDNVKRELEESNEFNSSHDNLVIDEEETKKDKHISSTLPDELNVSFEEVAQRVQTHDEHDETQEESGSTEEIVEAEHEGSTVETGDINFDDDDDEDYEMPLTQNTHRPRYINSLDENEDSLDSKDSKDIDTTANSDSGNEGDIFPKWAEKKKGDKLQR